jgi:hypothetical protein
MSPQRHDVEPEVTLPAGMELVIPPPAPEEMEDRPRGTGGARRIERATFPPLVHHGETRLPPAA